MCNHKELRLPPDEYTEQDVGTYAMIRRDMMFYCKRDMYDDLYNKGELLKHLKYVQKWADELIADIKKKYSSLGPATQLNIIEDYVGSWAGNFYLEKYKKELLYDVRNAFIHCLNEKIENYNPNKSK